MAMKAYLNKCKGCHNIFCRPKLVVQELGFCVRYKPQWFGTNWDWRIHKHTGFYNDVPSLVKDWNKYAAKGKICIGVKKEKENEQA